jgi:hypothetical protein
MRDILFYQPVTVVSAIPILHTLDRMAKTVQIKLKSDAMNPVDVSMEGEQAGILEVQSTNVLLVSIPPKVVVGANTKILVFCKSEILESINGTPTLIRNTFGDNISYASDVEDAIQRAMRYLHRTDGGGLMSLRRGNLSIPAVQTKISIALSRLNRAASSLKLTGAKVESAKLLSVKQVTPYEATSRYGSALQDVGNRPRIVAYISMKVSGTATPVVASTVV